MKKPALFLTVLSVSIILSTALVSTVISSIATSFYKENTENVRTVPVENPSNQDIKEATVKL